MYLISKAAVVCSVGIQFVNQQAGDFFFWLVDAVQIRFFFLLKIKKADFSPRSPFTFYEMPQTCNSLKFCK